MESEQWCGNYLTCMRSFCKMAPCGDSLVAQSENGASGLNLAAQHLKTHTSLERR